MNKTMHHILQELEAGLLHASTDEAVSMVSRSIEQLQGYMRLYVFQHTAEEILYFKVFKPRFLGHRICAESAFKQTILYPWVEHTFEQQQFYHYYTADLSHRDGFYFTERRCSKLDFTLEDLNSFAGKGYDQWVARILAEEWSAKKMS